MGRLIIHYNESRANVWRAIQTEISTDVTLIIYLGHIFLAYLYIPIKNNLKLKIIYLLKYIHVLMFTVTYYKKFNAQYLPHPTDENLQSFF